MKKLFRGITVVILSLVLVFTLSACDLESILSDILNPEEPSPSTSASPSASTPSGQTSTDELSMHFLMLGNKYAGDAVYIKIGDVDILVDAGSRTNSATAIGDYINDYCTDGTLEYVIATHAHQDHIAAFAGTSKIKSLFEMFECETIIDFPLTNATSTVYKNYVTKRDAEVAAGAKHYTALECWNDQNGAKRDYELAEGVTLSILYNYYYENETSNENNYSVCFMITQGDNHYLFTGDLEGEGEERLVQNNNLPHCEVFKAAHHGSYTGTTEDLLKAITPDIIPVTCVAGSDEYTSADENMFPSKAFCDRAKGYTDKIYVTCIISDNEDGYEPLNGNIVISSNGGEVKVNCSNNNTLLKDTDWYKAHRAA